MIGFIIKSTISLAVLYIFYYLLLRNFKMFMFNRYYLLFSLFFSIIIPFCNIRIGFDVSINQDIQDFSASAKGFIIQNDLEYSLSVKTFTVVNIIFYLYLFTSLILFIRLVLNLNKIKNKIRISKKTDSTSPNIVLVKENTLPYSFFKYIIVNENDYKNGYIAKELLIHEQVHCKQYHSLDILLVEIIKILLWFNPFVWIFKKEIQLIHEYLADDEVLLKHDRKTYQNLLINLVFRNNFTYLTSNFNCSLTKKRLIMMTKNSSSVKSTVRKITVILMVLLLAFTISFSQENIPNDSITNFNDEWWYPILEKHDIELTAFNNFKNVFETGTTNSIRNRIVILTDAIFIIKETDTYSILKSPLAFHDLNKNTISGNKGSIQRYKMGSDNIDPFETFAFKNFSYALNKGETSWVVEDVNGRIKSK